MLKKQTLSKVTKRHHANTKFFVFRLAPTVSKLSTDAIF